MSDYESKIVEASDDETVKIGVRIHALYGSKKISPGEIRSLLSSPHGAVRAAVAFAAGDLLWMNEASEKLYEIGTEDSEPRVRFNLACFLERGRGFPDERRLPALQILTKDEHPGVREIAVRALKNRPWTKTPINQLPPGERDRVKAEMRKEANRLRAKRGRPPLPERRRPKG